MQRNYFTSQASKKPSQIPARLKALHGTSSTNVLLTLADYGRCSQKYEERPLGNARLNFEELTTVLSQIKAWQAVTLQKLNKRHYPSQNVTVGDIVVMADSYALAYRSCHQDNCWQRWSIVTVKKRARTYTCHVLPCSLV